nr:pentapeptide repeat-containing protein [Rubricella aquisinus]
MSKGNFNFSNFEGARLNNSMIMGAKIENCWFFQSDLQNSFLEDAYCKQSLFSLANLENCYLGGAEMLTYPCLDKQQLSDAIGSDDTLLPEASERPPKWPTHKEQAREVWMKRTAATGLPTSK